MDTRTRIPAFALLSLSLTECVQRAPGADDADDIIGEWHAVALDADIFPMFKGDAQYSQRAGVALRVEAGLDGALVRYVEVDYEGYLLRYEQGSTIVVDASDAPKYRIDVTRDPLAGGDHYDEEGYYDHTATATLTSPTGYDSGYEVATGMDPTTGDTDSTGDTTGTTGGDTTGTTGDTTGGDSSGDSSGGSSGSSGGVLDQGPPARPLAIPLAPPEVPAEMVLRCTLDADVLTCTRDGDTLPKKWVFNRDEEEQQGG